jgi:predicted RNase H-like HicB family nuclease
MKYVYPALFQPEEGGFFISFPDIDGCFTQAPSIPEGLDMAADALNLMLWHMEEKNVDIPAPSPISKIKGDGDSFVTLISADTLAYRRQNDTKAVRKNLSLPRWLDTLATEHNLNFSNILQNALMKELGVTKA